MPVSSASISGDGSVCVIKKRGTTSAILARPFTTSKAVVTTVSTLKLLVVERYMLVNQLLGPHRPKHPRASLDLISAKTRRFPTGGIQISSRGVCHFRDCLPGRLCSRKEPTVTTDFNLSTKMETSVSRPVIWTITRYPAWTVQTIQNRSRSNDDRRRTLDYGSESVVRSD